MVFRPRELLFSKLFYRHQQQQQPPLPVLRAAAGNRSFFSRISDDTLGTFFVWFWTLLVLQKPRCFPCRRGDFFEAVLPASAAAAAATSSARSCQATEGCFSRISEVTLGTFLAWFWNLLVLQRHGVFPPAGDFSEAVLPASAAAAAATSSASSRRQQKVVFLGFQTWR